MPAEYLLRLDDACPTMDHARWQALEQVLAAHGISPIVAIVPDNADPQLNRGASDAGFWDRARRWASLGWQIGLHGLRHELRPARGGLVPINRFAEFTGLPWVEQKRSIAEGIRIMEGRGLYPEVWVAPAHGFDLATLQALREESNIRTVSDGFSFRACQRLGFTWLPQQLWKPREMKSGLWTICLHPNEMEQEAVARLDQFITTHRDLFPSPQVAASRAVPYGAADMMFGAAFLALLYAKKMIAGRNSE